MKPRFANPKRRQRRTMRQEKAKSDVAEIYSPPRITKMAREMGMNASWALDLTEVDQDDGMPWDLSKPEKRSKAVKRLDEDKPLMLIGCPMCGALSTWQNTNYDKMNDKEKRLKIA